MFIGKGVPTRQSGTERGLRLHVTLTFGLHKHFEVFRAVFRHRWSLRTSS